METHMLKLPKSNNGYPKPHSSGCEGFPLPGHSCQLPHNRRGNSYSELAISDRSKPFSPGKYESLIMRSHPCAQTFQALAGQSLNKVVITTTRARSLCYWRGQEDDPKCNDGCLKAEFQKTLRWTKAKYTGGNVLGCIWTCFILLRKCRSSTVWQGLVAGGILLQRMVCMPGTFPTRSNRFWHLKWTTIPSTASWKG